MPGWIAATSVANALFWLATWTLYHCSPPFADTVVAVVAKMSRGLFIGVLMMLRVSVVSVGGEPRRSSAARSSHARFGRPAGAAEGTLSVPG